MSYVSCGLLRRRGEHVGNHISILRDGQDPVRWGILDPTSSGPGPPLDRSKRLLRRAHLRESNSLVGARENINFRRLSRLDRLGTPPNQTTDTSTTPENKRTSLGDEIPKKKKNTRNSRDPKRTYSETIQKELEGKRKETPQAIKPYGPMVNSPISAPKQVRL